jgi:hypothetical protein
MEGMEKTNPNRWIVTIKNRHTVPRGHPNYNANRYETFGPYSEAEANAVADRIVMEGFRVLIHQLELWPR